MLWDEFLQVVRKGQDWAPPERLLAIDPGQTIGWAIFEEGKLVDSGQIPCKDNPALGALQLLDMAQPTEIICEDYKIYAHKADVHIGDGLFTPQLIGMIKLLCAQRGIPIKCQMAATAKAFCTPEKLKTWGLYRKGARHADDAIKHGCHYLLFNGKGKKK